ncbi:putative lysosomal cystine transporter [Rosa chinensis]|uniref:Putative lysosomal cystine transporter n=1 Tax=Rosa chinensis TaxID=74649 RepID=A0A2P6S646_ROSCH|nr:putative lysosomal cystine transporter [Rosa chinensis]
MLISVVGLSIDFVVLNLTKHSSYLIYNATFRSSTLKSTVSERLMIPVAANDVAFSAHAVFVTSVILFQIAIHEPDHFVTQASFTLVSPLCMQQGSQKLSKIAIGIVFAVWLFAAVCFLVALPTHYWLWLISVFEYIRYTDIVTFHFCAIGVSF